MNIRTMMRFYLVKAYFYGMFHPWHTEEDRLRYAERSLKKLEAWAERREGAK